MNRNKYFLENRMVVKSDHKTQNAWTSSQSKGMPSCLKQQKKGTKMFEASFQEIDH